MYLGEGKLYYERMGEFINVAKDLQIKEISKGAKIPTEEEDINEESAVNDEKTDSKEDYQRQTSENKVRQRKPRNQISSDAKSIECPDCGKVFTQRGHMVTHYRSKHEGIKYPCNLCDYQASYQSHLTTHIQSKHEGIKYPCNQCDYQSTQQSNLQTHIKRKHKLC